MVRKIYVLLIFVGFVLIYSCNTNSELKESNDKLVMNRILQQEDGTIALNVENADCYHDKINPSSNTAEWNVVVSKSGRFNVWLSSATRDTTDLQYKNPVMLSILDNRLESHPECDKIFQNSGDVELPYFRADSFMGALYIQDTGLYNIQLISEKIVPQDEKNDDTSTIDNSRLISVFLTPITR